MSTKNGREREKTTCILALLSHLIVPARKSGLPGDPSSRLPLKYYAVAITARRSRLRSIVRAIAFSASSEGERGGKKKGASSISGAFCHLLSKDFNNGREKEIFRDLLPGYGWTGE